MRVAIRSALALLVTLVLSVTALTAQADETRYVALGDSAAAGPLVLPIDTSSVGCLRSTANYPHVAARALGVPLKDVTCSSATTTHFTQPQSLPFGGPAAPQFDALDANTGLVTLTIGGNDTGLVGLALDCLNLLPPPWGRPCVDRYMAGGVDQIGNRITNFEPVFGGVLEQLKAKAPNARVYVVGYGKYLPRNGCYPVVPVLRQDANYIQAKISQLNGVLARQAAAHGVNFVDIETPSTGHDVCRAPGVKWYEAVVPTSVAAPLHPNKTGMRGTGLHLAGVVSGA